jgi:uncharacterized protein (TIGR02145 family)
MKSKVYLFSLIITSVLELRSQTIMNIHQNNGSVIQIPLNTIDSITYTITNPGNLASITTTAVTNITLTSAISGGNITNDGGSLITQRGICYGTNTSPTTANSTVVSGSGIGTFTSTLTGLTANTTYYARAYATNSAGTVYGNEVSFSTIANGTGIVSNPGAGVTFNSYTYSSIILGNGQEWMAENLRTNSYANGDPIANISDAIQWSTLTTGAWVHYNNASQYENPYGKLYNWYAVVDARNVCPTGWHVPSDIEWSTFINYLDQNANGGNNGNTAGGKMKSPGTQYWLSPNQDATNESGFAGLPGGYRDDNGPFSHLGNSGYWWSSTEVPIDSAWFRLLAFNFGDVDRNGASRIMGFSVRCIKD